MVSDSRQAGSFTIEVTPEMIEAGYRVFKDAGIVDDPLEADKLSGQLYT